MGTLKFKIGNIEFEYDASAMEIQTIIMALLGETPENDSFPSRVIVSETGKPLTKTLPVKPAKQSKLDMPLPDKEEVKKYIRSKPDYEHDTIEIQERFFGQNFKSRGKTAHMYHKVASLMREVRQEIEKEDHGKFEFKLTSGVSGNLKNLRQYVFKKEPEQLSLELENVK